MVPYCAQQSSLQWPWATLGSFSNALIPSCFALELLSCNSGAWVPMMRVPSASSRWILAQTLLCCSTHIRMSCSSTPNSAQPLNPIPEEAGREVSAPPQLISLCGGNSMSSCGTVIPWQPYTNNYQQKDIWNKWKSVQLFKLRKSSDITKNIIQYFISSKG